MAVPTDGGDGVSAADEFGEDARPGIPGGTDQNDMHHQFLLWFPIVIRYRLTGLV